MLKQFTKYLAALLLAGMALAQQPIGVNGFIGMATTTSSGAGITAYPSPLSGAMPGSIDYWNLSTAAAWGNTSGDTWRYTSWAANSLLSLFPDPSGLPVMGGINDGSAPGCSASSNAGLTQLSKLSLYPFSPVPSSSNTLITPLLAGTGGKCAFGADNGWSQSLTAPYCTSCLGTWKGGDVIFSQNLMYANFYRQDSPGNIWGDSTLFMSPDAGQHWIDYEHYFTFPITAASCSGGTVTLTATNTSTVGDIVYVHDLGTGWDGKRTLTAAAGASVQFAATCPGSAAVITAESAYGAMKAVIDAPDGPNNAAYSAGNGSMMWTGSPNQMTFFEFIHFGQDGSWDIPADSGCDPRNYVCFYAMRRSTNGGNASGESTVLVRFPVGHAFTKSQYQWYTCAGYDSLWPDPSTVCDGNLSSSWTSSIGSATSIRNNADGGATWPGDCISTKFFAPHGSYLTACSMYAAQSRGLGHYAYFWHPHPWGPFYPTGTNLATMYMPANSWEGLMGYGEQVVSTTPPLTRTVMAGLSSYGSPMTAGTGNTSGTTVTCLTNCVFDSTWIGRDFQANSIGTTVASVASSSSLTTVASLGTSSGSAWSYANHPSGAAVVFSTIEFGPGRAMPAGAIRRYNTTNFANQNIGHRFSAGGGSGSIPLAGKASDGSSWSLDWWTDLWDHGGQILGNFASRPFMKELVSSGSRYFTAVDGSAGAPAVGFTARATLDPAGVLITNGYAVSNARFDGSWTDSTTMNGNSSYTMLAIFNIAGNGWADSYNESSATLIYEGTGGNTTGQAAVMSVSGYHLSAGVNGGTGFMGDLCWRSGGPESYAAPTNQLGYCTVSLASGSPATSDTVQPSKWYLGAITVKAVTSANPIVTINLCHDGACTEYGGGTCDLHSSASGTNCNGLWKWCSGSGCSAAPNVTSDVVRLGWNPQNNGGGSGPTAMSGVMGEAAVFKGTVPSNQITNIYRAVRDEWIRAGRITASQM